MLRSGQGGNNMQSEGGEGNIIQFPEGGRQGIIERLMEERDALKKELNYLRVRSSKENIARQKELEREIKELDSDIFDNLEAMNALGKPKNTDDNGDDDYEPPKRAT